MQKEMTMQHLINDIIKHWYLVIIIIILGGGAGYVYANHNYNPRYSSHALMLVSPKKETAKKIEAIKASMPTYQDLITSDAILTDVKKNLKDQVNYQVDVETLSNDIHTEAAGGSMVIKITTTASQKKLAAKTANLTILSLKKNIHKFSKIAKVKQITKSKSKNATLINGRSTSKYVLFGVLLGLVVSLFCVIALGITTSLRKDNANR